MGKKLDVECTYCGSNNVSASAQLYWSVSKQEWVIDEEDIADKVECKDCGTYDQVRWVEFQRRDD